MPRRARSTDGENDVHLQFPTVAAFSPDGNHLGLSHDGLFLYAAGTRSGTVACFGRSPLSGRLAYLDTIPDGGDGGPLGATSAVVSPDNRFVYVPTEDKKSISVFERVD